MTKIGLYGAMLCHERRSRLALIEKQLPFTLTEIDYRRLQTVSSTSLNCSMDFYDQLAPFYHILYSDWDAAIAQQSAQLSAIVRSQWGNQIQTILDVSCGVGTQALGLVAQGYQVTASDLSRQSIERAQREAQTRNLDIDFSVCDMRAGHRHHQAEFDVVISCDNSIPHLLNDAEILTALEQLYACTRPNGGCLLTIRDYDKEPRGTGIVKPYGIRTGSGKRYLVFQVWDFVGEVYDLSMYFVEDDQLRDRAVTTVMRSRYYAIAPHHLMMLMERVGYHSVTRLDDQFFQPVLVGTKY
ncbi:MAG TPA: class I SAM-dependent methyltransferase [Leptolyngbya sp.]|jgi:SAM-dependent methyltransferase|nr:class I SAM-dependent methyltransferase [Leptolyngbya sp.]